MPIKRTRAPAKKPRQKRTDAGAEPIEAPVSQDEKHRLIMAHAAMRPTRDPVQLMSMWAGVLVAVLAVVTGWWWSVGSGIAGSYKAGGIVETVKSIAPDPNAPKNEMADDLHQVTERLRAMHEQAAEQQKRLEALQAAAVTSSGAFALPATGTSQATGTATGTR